MQLRPIHVIAMEPCVRLGSALESKQLGLLTKRYLAVLGCVIGCVPEPFSDPRPLLPVGKPDP